MGEGWYDFSGLLLTALGHWTLTTVAGTVLVPTAQTGNRSGDFKLLKVTGLMQWKYWALNLAVWGLPTFARWPGHRPAGHLHPPASPPPDDPWGDRLCSHPHPSLCVDTWVPACPEGSTVPLKRGFQG